MEEKRRSLGKKNDLFQKTLQIMPKFLDKDYLTQHSLFQNLYSSESFSFSLPESDFSSIFFTKDSLDEGELYEHNYFY